MTKQETHRGPSKEGKKALAVQLTPEQHRKLAELAAKNHRSKSNHVAFLVEQALKAVE